MSIFFQIVLTVIGAFLSVMLTRILIQNGKYIRQNGEAIRQNGEALRYLIKLVDERTREILKRL